MTAPAWSMSVVAGVDGSPASALAVRWAAAAAVRGRLPLRLVHAAPPLPLSTFPAAALYVDDLRKAAWEDGERFLSEAATEAEKLAPGVEVLTWHQIGDPTETLARASAAARFVVVGATGRSGLQEMLAGSTALELPIRSHAPAVIARPRGDGELARSGPVVVGVAGNPLDDPAVEFAFEQASLLGVPLTAVHTWSDSPLPDLDRLTGHVDDWNAIFERERRLLAEGLAGYRERFPEVTVQPVVVYDRPARALLERTQQAQLLVVGTRGRGIVASAVLGSTSRAVIKLSECPVAVVRRYG